MIETYNISKASREYGLIESISHELDRKQVVYEREVLCHMGYIDILIKAETPMIIEVKGDSQNSSITRAIGQLLCYELAYPGALLFLAVPEGVHKYFLPVLKRVGIMIWPNPCTLCDHPSIVAFDAAIARGVKAAVISTQRRVSKDLILEHIRHKEQALREDQCQVLDKTPLARVKQAWQDANDDPREQARIVAWLNEVLQAEDMGL